MIFHPIDSAPIDRRLEYNVERFDKEHSITFGKEHLLTIGRGSYAVLPK